MTDDEPIEVVEPRPEGNQGRRGRGPLWAVLAVGVAGGMVAAALVARSGGDRPDAAEALARARAAMAEAGTYRMRAIAEDRTFSGDPGGAGSDSSYRTVTESEVAGADWRETSDAGDWADEVVGVGGQIYIRSADDADGLAAEPWVVMPADTAPAGADILSVADEMSGMPGFDDEELLSDDTWLMPMLAAEYLGGTAAPGGGEGGAPVVLPTGFVDAFGAFEDAEVVDDGGPGLRLRATRSAPDDLVEQLGRPLPNGEIEIVLGEDDLPTRLILTVEGDSASHRDDITFTDWGADITVAVPEGEIDETPWLDEEALAEARAGVTPVAPTVVPDGLVLTDVYPMSADDSGEGCAEIDLTYGPEDAAAWEAWDDYLDVYLVPADCALAYDDTPFAPGPYGDLPYRDVDDLPAVLVGDTVVQFSTSYGDDVLAALVASLAPIDLDAEVARTAAYAEASWEGG